MSIEWNRTAADIIAEWFRTEGCEVVAKNKQVRGIPVVADLVIEGTARGESGPFWVHIAGRHTQFYGAGLTRTQSVEHAVARAVAAAQSAEEAGALWVVATTLLPATYTAAGRLLDACIHQIPALLLVSPTFQGFRWVASRCCR